MLLSSSVIGYESLLEKHDPGQGGSLQLRPSLKEMTSETYLLTTLPTSEVPSNSFLGNMSPPHFYGYHALALQKEDGRKLESLPSHCRPNFIPAIET